MKYRNFYKNYFPEWVNSETNPDNIGNDGQRMFGIPGEDPLVVLEKVFHIDEDSKRETFEDKFDQAISGDGQEIARILTLHSSSLLSLMNFWQVSESNPLFHEGVEYTKVYFERKNNVIPGRKPSNIDIVLVSRDGKTILFLESKFTEYLNPGKTWVSEAYLPFYKMFESAWHGFIEIGETVTKVKKDKRGQRTETEFALSSANCRRGEGQYLAGIKQMISHLIGIINGPIESSVNNFHSDYVRDFQKAKTFKLGTILFSLEKEEECDAYKRYQELYTQCFGSIGLNLCFNILRELNPHMSDTRAMYVIEKPLTYQELFKDKNKNLLLPRVQEMYYSKTT